LKHFYIYAIFFEDKTLDLGVFSTTADIIEGDTEENIESILKWLCEESNLDFSNCIKYAVKGLPHTFLENAFNSSNPKGN
jgi:hypothetical protein